MTTTTTTTNNVQLITGGAGFIGSNVAHRLLMSSSGDGRPTVVRILDDLSRPNVEKNIAWLRESHPGNDHCRFELVVADIRDANAVDKAMEGVTHVFHFAAQVAVTTSLSDPRADFTVNGLGALNVLEAIRRRPASRRPSLLYTSTNKVYGALDDVMTDTSGSRHEPRDLALQAFGVSEKRPLEFHSPYGCSKGTADQYVLDYARTYGIATTVFRMSCIYGPRQFGTEDQGWLAHFLIRALRGEDITIYGDGRQVRDVLYIDDLVEAMLIVRGRLRTRDPNVTGRVFNVGGGPRNTLSLLELLERIERLTKRTPRTVFEDWRLADQRWYVSDPRALSRAVGWQARVGVDQGVARLYDWLTQQPELRSAPASAQKPHELIGAPP